MAKHQFDSSHGPLGPNHEVHPYDREFENLERVEVQNGGEVTFTKDEFLHLKLRWQVGHNKESWESHLSLTRCCAFELKHNGFNGERFQWIAKLPISRFSSTQVEALLDSREVLVWGLAARHGGDIETAEQAVRDLVAATPNDPRVDAWVAWCLAEAARRDEEIRVAAEKVAAQFEKDVSATERLAEVLKGIEFPENESLVLAAVRALRQGVSAREALENIVADQRRRDEYDD
ncbi:MAG: hypothetical protein KBD15_00960 [Candidatus Magasanikbacteria bacterium]|jgi:hypothetical protein|nr:hypothetical protein [Candidatus Magasanikbacteria bacterium]